MKHFLLLGVKSVRITKIENNVDFPSFPFVSYSDVRTDNCVNTFLSSDSAKLKLSKCYCSRPGQVTPLVLSFLLRWFNVNHRGLTREAMQIERLAAAGQGSCGHTIGPRK